MVDLEVSQRSDCRDASKPPISTIGRTVTPLEGGPVPCFGLCGTTDATAQRICALAKLSVARLLWPPVGPGTIANRLRNAFNDQPRAQMQLRSFGSAFHSR